jgi:hypothetical protein
MSKHSAAFPTYPVQGEMGNLIISFGVSKIEHFAAQFLTKLLDENDSEGDKKNIANKIELSYKIANDFLQHCEDIAMVDMMKGSQKTNIITGD